MKQIYYDADIQGKNNKITFQPTDKIVSEEVLTKGKKLIQKSYNIDIESYGGSVSILCNSTYLKNKLDYIGEIILFCVNNIAILKAPKVIIINMLSEVFSNFDYSEYSNHKLFRNYKIQKTAEQGVFLFKIPSLPQIIKCSANEKKLNAVVSKIEEIKALHYAFYASIENNSINTVSNIIKELLEDSYEVLNSLSTENQEKYQYAIEVINIIKNYLDPKFQLKVTQALKEHLKENNTALSEISKLLIDNGYYEEAVKLLKPKLLNVTSATSLTYEYMYNLALSYMELGKFKKAEQYFLEALKGLPNNENIINDLWSIYRSTSKTKEAEKLLFRLPQNTKNFYDLSLTTYAINKKNLELVDKKTLSPNLLNSYKCYEYISKYNSYSDNEKNRNQKKISNELKQLIASIKTNKLSTLSLALYTKQNEIALDILKEMPKGFFKTFPNLIRLKALLDPDSVLSLEEKYVNADDISNIFSAVCNSLIAEKRHDLVTKVMEDVKGNRNISDEIYNEIKFIIDLFKGNKEQAKEYAIQLSDEKKDEIIENFSSIDKQIDNIEQLIEEFDAKKIHEYYQTKKKHDFLLLKEEITNVASSYWILQNGKKITTEKAKFIGKFKGKNCYGIISEKLESKVGSLKFNIFKKTLEEKGLIFKKFAQNGVKFLKKAFEIKINDDERIFTNEVYENPEEEILLNFTHNGDHNEVRNFLILIGCNLEYNKFA